MSKFKRFKSGYGVTYNDAGEPRVAFWDTEKHQEGEVLTGEEAKRFIARGNRATSVLQILFLPLSAVFYLIVGINNATEWLLRKFMGEK